MKVKTVIIEGMIKVDLDKIITLNALKAHLESILFQVEEKELLFVITKKGRPRAALINVDYLEEITGRSVEKEATEYQNYDRHLDTPVDLPMPPKTEPLQKPPVIIPPSPSEPKMPVPPVKTNVIEKEENLDDLDIPELSIDDIELPEDEPEVVAKIPPKSDLITAASKVAEEKPNLPATPPPSPAPNPTTPSIDISGLFKRDD